VRNRTERGVHTPLTRTSNVEQVSLPHNAIGARDPADPDGEPDRTSCGEATP